MRRVTKNSSDKSSHALLAARIIFFYYFVFKWWDCPLNVNLKSDETYIFRLRELPIDALEKIWNSKFSGSNVRAAIFTSVPSRIK